MNSGPWWGVVSSSSPLANTAGASSVRFHRRSIGLECADWRLHCSTSSPDTAEVRLSCRRHRRPCTPDRGALCSILANACIESTASTHGPDSCPRTTRTLGTKITNTDPRKRTSAACGTALELLHPDCWQHSPPPHTPAQPLENAAANTNTQKKTITNDHRKQSRMRRETDPRLEMLVLSGRHRCTDL